MRSGVVQIHLVIQRACGVYIHRVECHKGAGVVRVAHRTDIQIVVIRRAGGCGVEAQPQLVQHSNIGVHFGQHHAFPSGHTGGGGIHLGQIHIYVLADSVAASRVDIGIVAVVSAAAVAQETPAGMRGAGTCGTSLKAFLPRKHSQRAAGGGEVHRIPLSGGGAVRTHIECVACIGLQTGERQGGVAGRMGRGVAAQRHLGTPFIVVGSRVGPGKRGRSVADIALDDAGTDAGLEVQRNVVDIGIEERVRRRLCHH